MECVSSCPPPIPYRPEYVRGISRELRRALLGGGGEGDLRVRVRWLVLVGEEDADDEVDGDGLGFTEG